MHTGWRRTATGSRNRGGQEPGWARSCSPWGVRGREEEKEIGTEGQK